MKLTWDFFKLIYGYEITWPGFADRALTALEAVGCSRARDHYKSWVSKYKACLLYTSNHIVDGVRIDVNPEIYGLGIPVMSIAHELSRAETAYAAWEEAEPQLKAFVFDTCGAEANWNMKNFVEDQVELIRRQVGDKKVLLALSRCV